MKNFLLLLVFCFSLAIYGKTNEKIDPCCLTEKMPVAYISNPEIILYDTIAFTPLEKDKLQSPLELYPDPIYYVCDAQCRSPA